MKNGDSIETVIGRRCGTRTHGLTLPRRALYQTELIPDKQDSFTLHYRLKFYPNQKDCCNCLNVVIMCAAAPQTA